MALLKITCPSCSASGSADESMIPPEGRSVGCPRCGTRFHVRRDDDAPSESPPGPVPERMTCPRCGCEQEKAVSCSACGVVVEKYRKTISPAEPDPAEALRSRANLRATDVWYRDMFDRRLSMLLVRVLSLLLLVGLFLGYRMNNARMAAKAAAIEVSSGPTTAERNAESDRKFTARFDPVVTGLNADIEQCFRQCYGYLQTPWYAQGDARPQGTTARQALTESMERERTEIVNKRKENAKEYVIPTPSPKYYDCYYKVRHLSNLYDTLARYSEEHMVYRYGFSGELAKLTAEHVKLQEELGACRRSLFEGGEGGAGSSAEGAGK